MLVTISGTPMWSKWFSLKGLNSQMFHRRHAIHHTRDMIFTFSSTSSTAIRIVVRLMNDIWYEYTSDVITLPNSVDISRSVNSIVNIICWEACNPSAGEYIHDSMQNIQGLEIFYLLECYAAFTGCPETSVTTNLHCVTCEQSDDLVYTPAEAWNHTSAPCLKLQ